MLVVGTLCCLLTVAPLWSCTIVSGSAPDGSVWAGNNEDFIFDFETYLNVLPPASGKFGAVFFTYDGPTTFPQGGMNERGLFYDLNTIPNFPRSEYRDYAKRKPFPGGDTQLLLHMLKTCATVADALALLERFQLDDLFEEQLHLADRTGELAVVTAQGVVRPPQPAFQVSTNFNLATQLNAAEGQSCWRFPIANRILNTRGVSMESIRSVLDATQQPRQASTIYSNIMNLATGDVYLYYAADFEHAKHYRWADLMALPTRSVLMRTLFPDAPIVRIYEEGRAKGVDAARALFRELETTMTARRRGEVLRHLLSNALQTTYRYPDAHGYFEEWVRVTGGKDPDRPYFQGLVSLVNGNVEAAMSAFGEQEKSAADAQSADMARKLIARLRGQPPKESNVTVELKGFRDARFVALDGLGPTATPNFLIRTADGWRGEFHVPPGKLQYAFIVDGKRILDPVNKRQEDKWSQGGTRRFSVRLIPASGGSVSR
jgi:hypothetical protein